MEETSSRRAGFAFPPLSYSDVQACAQIFFLIIIFFIVVDFVIHWNETAMGLHVFPIPFSPPSSLSTRSL